MSATDPVAMTLPIAPVVNKLWAPVRTARGARFVKRSVAQDWADEARWRVAAERAGRTIDGEFAATIMFPETTADIDARIKPTLDACQHGGAISNDKHCRRLLVEIDPSLPRGLMRVVLQPLPPVERAPRRTKGTARKEPTP